MRIEKISIKNYRQFRDIKMEYNRSTGKDLHIIVATNATGKTNLLNAINWCLYDEEPNMSEKTMQLPRLNMETVKVAGDGTKERVEVEVTTTTTDGTSIIFTRWEEYEIQKEGEQEPKCLPRDRRFQVAYFDEKKNPKLVTDEDAQDYVNRFVPWNLKEFFFFDGERLESYFHTLTGDQIRAAVFEISQVDKIQSMEEHLEEVIKDLLKTAGRKSPQLDEINQQIQDKTSEYNDMKNKLEKLGKEMIAAKDKVEELDDKLRNIPNVAALERERANLIEERENKRAIFDEKIKKRRDLLFEYGKIVKLYPSLQRATEIIQVMVKNKEIPQTYDTKLLDNILSTRLCICDRIFDKGSPPEKAVQKVRNEITVSSDVARKLIDMQGSLGSLQQKTDEFENTIKGITSDINLYSKDLERMQERIDDTGSTIVGHNVELIGQLYKEREDFQQIAEDNNRHIGILEVTAGDVSKQLAATIVEFSKASEKADIQEELKQDIAFSKAALSKITEIKNEIMDRVRKRIEDETKNYFFNLVWKKDTFSDAYIDHNYVLHLIHKQGYECVGSLSQSERQLLALSMVLSLHTVSGYDSPILVDSPVGRVDEEQRGNFADVLLRVSSDKQIILLCLPVEYSKELRVVFESSASSQRRLELLGNQLELAVKEVH